MFIVCLYILEYRNNHGFGLYRCIKIEKSLFCFHLGHIYKTLTHLLCVFTRIMDCTHILLK